jgi:hypothetical protein
MGYYGVLLGLEIRNERQMMERLDAENYDNSKAVLIKVPITIPYATDSQEFERVDGIFEHNGEFFRLVKQRLYRDTLHIVCVKDDQQKEIAQAFAIYAGSLTDKSTDNSSVKMPDMIKEYLPSTISISVKAIGWGKDIPPSIFKVDLIHDYIASIIHPPERA